MLPATRRTNLSNYYDKVADQLEEASKYARIRTGDNSEVVQKLKTYAERIREDLKRKRA